jgi:hypothetical protein
MSINPEWVSPAPYETNDMERSPTNTVVSTIMYREKSQGSARVSAEQL